MLGSSVSKTKMLVISGRDAVAEGALRDDRQAPDAEARTAAEAWQGGQLVIGTRYGTPTEPRNFHRDFKARCAKAGVRPAPVHSTQRTWASALAARDVHPRSAMQILRHSQIAVTINTYSEVSSAETRQAPRRIGQQVERNRLMKYRMSGYAIKPIRQPTR